jgi:hypothetical protein
VNPEKGDIKVMAIDFINTKMSKEGLLAFITQYEDRLFTHEHPVTKTKYFYLREADRFVFKEPMNDTVLENIEEYIEKAAASWKKQQNNDANDLGMYYGFENYAEWTRQKYCSVLDCLYPFALIHRVLRDFFTEIVQKKRIKYYLIKALITPSKDEVYSPLLSYLNTAYDDAIIDGLTDEEKQRISDVANKDEDETKSVAAERNFLIRDYHHEIYERGISYRYVFPTGNQPVDLHNDSTVFENILIADMIEQLFKSEHYKGEENRPLGKLIICQRCAKFHFAKIKLKNVKYCSDECRYAKYEQSPEVKNHRMLYKRERRANGLDK